MSSGWLSRLAVAALVVFSPGNAADAGDDALTFGAGAFAVFSEGDRQAQGEIQFRPDWRWWKLQPMIGGFATAPGHTLFGYIGISADFALRGLVLRPSFAPGFYSRGDGRDLGNTILFRTGLGVAWEFESGHRLGIDLYHLSNAGLADHNPGAESAMLTFTLPIRW